MGLIDKQRQRQHIDQKNSIQLTKDECELLLNMISKTTFLGKDVEVVYETVFKIQDYYESLDVGR